MSDERDGTPETGSFDADEWFRTQFGGEQPPAPAAVPPVAPPPPAAPVPPPVSPVVPPPTTRVVSVPPPTSPVVSVPPPPALVEPAPAPPVYELEPTQPTAVIGEGPTTIGDAATELLREPEQGGALDELFGGDSFQEYNEPLIPAAPRSSRRGKDGAAGAVAGDGGSGLPPTDGTTPRAPLGRTQKILLWVAGALVALLALIAVFFVGTRIPLLLGPAPGAQPSPTATPTPTPTATARPIGPVEPGEYRWDELWGGECLEPYSDAWQEDYTVVDCAEPHAGQLVLRAPFALPDGATEQGPFPGEEVLAAQMSLLCSAPGVLNLSAAAAFTDLQVQGAFPVTEEDWDAGEQDYFCFAARATGEPLTGSLAVPPPAT